ncbi:MAG: cytochrome c biogenesis protein CcdA [Gracilibacteraceae bacterium]|jgi:cytochrome c-type biogenesis protein|nr:cytochrome c biogenesis protein CcdA [Gracilibacteraceae bacterium]
MQYLLLFLEGVITFISPCLLPMLPIYISYFAANRTGKRKTLTNALGFVLGFTLVFAAMGTFAGTLGKLLVKYGILLNIVTGSVVVVFGLNFLGIFKIGFLNQTRGGTANVKNLGFFSSVLFGLIFSVSWTPCAGAFLGSALMTAAQSGSAGQGTFMLLVFSLGLGAPFLFSAVLIEQLKGTFDFIKKNYKVVNTFAGGLLVVVGILMATGLMGRFLALLTF